LQSEDRGKNVRLATKLTGWKIDVVEKKKRATEDQAETTVKKKRINFLFC